MTSEVLSIAELSDPTLHPECQLGLGEWARFCKKVLTSSIGKTFAEIVHGRHCMFLCQFLRCIPQELINSKFLPEFHVDQLSLMMVFKQWFHGTFTGTWPDIIDGRLLDAKDLGKDFCVLRQKSLLKD